MVINSTTVHIGFIGSNRMIPFNKPPYLGSEDIYVLQAMRSSKMSGDGEFSKKCQSWFEQKFDIKKALITPNCTQALEMAAILIDIKPGDEVIMPSYTFVSTANAFVLRGAKIVFVDIKSEDMNIDENLIEAAITPKTKAIVPVHYAGVACEMDSIMSLASKYGLFVIEDAAQAVMSYYKGRPLGSIGHFGAYSFHETKNYTSGGEGGLLAVNDERFLNRAEIIREKGTNRSKFFRGMVDKYSWVDIGSSYLPSEIQAAYLFAQLESVEQINDFRLLAWSKYYEGLSSLLDNNKISLPVVPEHCKHNAHMFYIKAKDLAERTQLLDYLKVEGIQAAFHYIPLHTSSAGLNFSSFHDADINTSIESERLIRLPLWFGITDEFIHSIVNAIFKFYEVKN